MYLILRMRLASYCRTFIVELCACPDGLLNRDRFAGRRVGTILCGSNTTTGDLARRVLGDG
jgi:hypothetical protein